MFVPLKFKYNLIRQKLVKRFAEGYIDLYFII